MREIVGNIFLWSVLILLAIFVDTDSYDSDLFGFVGMITAMGSWIIAVIAGYFIPEKNYKIDTQLQLFRVSSVLAGILFIWQFFSNTWRFGENSLITMTQMNESAMQLHLMESGAGIFVIVTGLLLLRSVRAAA